MSRLHQGLTLFTPKMRLPFVKPKPDKKMPPAADEAANYVHRAIFHHGGWGEAIRGAWHKTIPFLLGLENSLTFGRIAALLLRLFILVAVAVYPLIIRKSFATTIPRTSGDFEEAVKFVAASVRSFDLVDGVLAAGALLVAAAPKLIEINKNRKKGLEQQHSPYYDLTAAIRHIPFSSTGVKPRQCDEALKLTLSALQDEMSQLIGEETHKRLTDVTLLEFCPPHGTLMQVRCRTASHEEIKRPTPSAHFVAYYVAREGRCFAEHDFSNAQNPFPARRVTIPGGQRIDYRSVLYIPVISSEKAKQKPTRGAAVASQAPANGSEAGTIAQVVDSCIAVICVHSSKPYRFWRWGDHKKAEGGFVDVAMERSMPYIALIKKLLLTR